MNKTEIAALKMLKTRPVKRVTVEVVDQEATGRIVRQARRTFGLGLRPVADQAGISFVHLSNLERGVRSWTTETVDRVSEAIHHLATQKDRSPNGPPDK